jgi:hypothetical protein
MEEVVYVVTLLFVCVSPTMLLGNRSIGTFSWQRIQYVTTEVTDTIPSMLAVLFRVKDFFLFESPFICKLYRYIQQMV